DPEEPVVGVWLREVHVDRSQRRFQPLDTVMRVESGRQARVERVAQIGLRRIAEAVGESRAELLADGDLRDQRRTVAIAGGINRREAIVRKPIPAPDHVLALYADVPGKPEPRRKVQVIG